MNLIKSKYLHRIKRSEDKIIDVKRFFIDSDGRFTGLGENLFEMTTFAVGGRIYYS